MIIKGKRYHLVEYASLSSIPRLLTDNEMSWAVNGTGLETHALQLTTHTIPAKPRIGSSRAWNPGSHFGDEVELDMVLNKSSATTRQEAYPPAVSPRLQFVF